MTNISKQQTKSNDYKLAYSELNKLIAKLGKNNANYLINELLTEAEQIMIVKRFAAIFMFQQNYSPYRVSSTLSISVSTAQRLQEQFNNNSFVNLLGCIKKPERNKFISLLEDLILAQASPRARARLMNRVL